MFVKDSSTLLFKGSIQLFKKWEKIILDSDL